jgi:hypothetical protein
MHPEYVQQAPEDPILAFLPQRTHYPLSLSVSVSLCSRHVYEKYYYAIFCKTFLLRSAFEEITQDLSVVTIGTSRNWIKKFSRCSEHAQLFSREIMDLCI